MIPWKTCDCSSIDLLEDRRKFVPADTVTRLAGINGELGAISYHDGNPLSVITLALEVADGRIRGVYIVSNPQKLAHLPAPPALADKAIVTVVSTALCGAVLR